MAQVEILILGQRYKVGCPDGEEDRLTESSEELNDQLLKMKDTHSSLRNDQLFVIAALNFCHQLNVEKTQNKQKTEDIDARLKSLQDPLDSVL